MSVSFPGNDAAMARRSGGSFPHETLVRSAVVLRPLEDGSVDITAEAWDNEGNHVVSEGAYPALDESNVEDFLDVVCASLDEVEEMTVDPDYE